MNASKDGGASFTAMERTGADFRLPDGRYGAAVNGEWLGSPSSALSFRRGILSRFLPLAIESEWRIRADDVLVVGAAIAGAHRFYLHCPLVRYRVHGGNAFFGRPMDEATHEQALERMRDAVLARLGLPTRREIAEREGPKRILAQYAHIRPFGRTFLRAWRAFGNPLFRASVRRRGRWALLRMTMANLFRDRAKSSRPGASV